MKILIAGEGGQGIQAVAQILSKAAFLEGKFALYIPNFGVEQRGGVSLAFLIIDDKEIFYPKFKKADIIALLAKRSFARAKSYLSDKTKIVLGPLVKLDQSLLKNDFYLVTNKDLPARVWNISALGMINKISGLVKEKNLIMSLDQRFANTFKKNPNLRKLDLIALQQ